MTSATNRYLELADLVLGNKKASKKLRSKARSDAQTSRGDMDLADTAFQLICMNAWTDCSSATYEVSFLET